MKRTIRLLRLVALSCAVTGGLAATSAAQTSTPSATTGAATSVTATTATLTGAITPGGNAINYQFQYGTTTSYGASTPAVALAASQSAETATAAISGLKPLTTYHYRLVISIAGPGPYYYPLAYAGGDRTFTTAALPVPKIRVKVRPLSKRIAVRHHVASIRIKCVSTVTCSGSLTLTKHVRVGRRFHNEKLGSQRFSLGSGKKGTVKVKLNRLGRQLLLASRHHKTIATLTGPDLKTTVTLVGT